MIRMCSYCGCESIEVIGRFMAEHVEIANGTTALRTGAAQGDPDGVARSARTLARVLSEHTTAEEVGLFTVLRRQDEFTQHVDSLCSEHDDLDRRLDAIIAGDLGQVPAFIRDLRSHMDREENGLFPAAAIALDGPDWEEVHDITPSPTGAHA